MTSRIPSPTDPDARVLYLTREGCHLCDEALPVVRAEADRAGSTVEVRDIDEDPALLADWDHDVPVIIVDGAVHARYRVDAAALRTALAKRPLWRRLGRRCAAPHDPPTHGGPRLSRGGPRCRSASAHFLLRRWWRVFRRSLRCFFFDMRLRRFLTTEPMGASVLQA